MCDSKVHEALRVGEFIENKRHWELQEGGRHCLQDTEFCSGRESSGDDSSGEW